MATDKKSRTTVTFIDTMDCLPVPVLPAGREWTYEIKLDGYRLEAVKNGRVTQLFSRRRNVLNDKFQYIADSLVKLPASSIIDGELVALDEGNRSDFNLLQNFRSAQSKIHYYAFDILMHKGKLLTQRPLAERRALLEKALPTNEHVSLSVVDSRPVAHMLKFVRDNGLEGVIAKRADSVYEPDYAAGRGVSTESRWARNLSSGATLQARMALMR